MASHTSSASDSEWSECSCCSCSASPEDLREELESRVIDQRTPIEEFVHAVYGVQQVFIERVKALDVDLPRETLQEYADGLAKVESGNTPCRLFKVIFDACVKTVRKELDIADESALQLCTDIGDYVEGGPQRSPDGMFLHHAARCEPALIAWRSVHHVLVVKDEDTEGGESFEGAVKDMEERSALDDLATASQQLKPTSPLSRQELKGAQYALECMSVDASRYHATVLCVDGTKVWLLYIDRDFVFRTTSFNFVNSPQLLAIVAYAMVYCTPARAGFDPHLQFPVVGADGTATYTSNVANPREFEGARFFFPESQGQPALSCTVKGFSPVYRDAIPSRRDPATYALTETNSNGEEMELKVCWTPRGRALEPNILKTLHETLPDMADHLLAVEAWRVEEPACPLLDLLDEETRRDCLEKRRRVVYQITPRLIPLWELDSIEEFKECFIDIVEVHFHACKHAEFIHSNISERSVAARRKLGRALGVLKDWDCAHLPNDARGPPDLQIGTGTLVAVELQQNTGGTDDPTHHYHHDLESFLFLLVWATLHFDFENKRRLPTKLPDWEVEWQTAVERKRRFIDDPMTFNEVIRLALPQFKDVVVEWVFPLVKLFRDGMRAADVMKVDAEGMWMRHFKEGIYAEKVTFEGFMRAIGRTPRKWLHEEAKT
ncbi:hypothetical protein K523DRAFT_364562 [Schizophyllum commune Tattone D]|nr:hypothetical protein K523DRAFT_364562 [Schizophyllum commune Tattone D]